MADELPRIGFIGAGRVGGALALALAEAGYPVTAVSSLHGASADAIASLIPGCRAVPSPQDVADACDIAFVATPDGAIEGTVNAVSWKPGTAVVHTSGSESRNILAPAARAGAETGSLHPLQTFADIEQARTNLPGSVFALEGEGRLLEALRGIVAALNAIAIELRGEDKVLYHAAAVMVSNYNVTLMKMATDLWLRFGVDRQTALNALLPLLRGSVANLEAVGLPQALTGPVARGDVSTVQKHISALEEAAPDMVAAYCELALQAIPVALARGGLTDSAAEQLRAVLATHRKAPISTGATRQV